MNRILGLLGLLILIQSTMLGHRGDYIAITDVQITESKDVYTYSFLIENVNDQNYSDVTIEFWINGNPIFSKYYPLLKADQKFLPEKFLVSKDLLNLKEDEVNIEITKIFGKPHDWGGWDSPNQKGHKRQANTLYSEFFVDAPWRMKKTDDQGNINPIPLHFFFHDADEVVGTTAQVDKIDIRIKNAKDNNFGPILTYNGISDSQFKSYFSDWSQPDNAMNTQGFSLNSFVSSGSNSINFNIQSDWLNDYVEVDATYWWFNFNIPPSDLVGYENEIDVQVTIHYGNISFSDDVIGMRIFRSDDLIPTLPNYFRGDTHLHSIYTQNDAEVGLPLEATKIAGKWIGLNWITTTDHTSDIDNYGNGLTNNWARIRSHCESLNQDDPSMIYIAGQEVALDNDDSKLVHMLAYPDYNDPYGFPFIGDGNGDLVSTSVTINSALDAIHTNNGFAYAAHPFATEDALPTFPVDGGIWNLGAVGFTHNGNNYPQTGGQVICNDMSLASDVFSPSGNKMVKDGLLGAQIWNVRNNLESTGDELDPWDIDNGGDGFSLADTNSYGHHLKRFRQGQEVVNYVNQLGLQMKNNNPDLQNWKMYFSGGSDAHGSFNSSNTDDVAGIGTINDNAVGKINTVVYCPDGMGADGEGVLEALKNGRSSLSDGPLMAIGISNDGDNASNEIMMGDDQLLDIYGDADYYLNFDYATTNEFGKMTGAMFIIGTESGEISVPMSQGWIDSSTQHYSYNLKQVLLDAFGTTPIPQEEYFYIRAEMRTQRDLSMVSSEHKTSYQIHHSFTNPIWLKYSEIYPEVANLTLTTRPNPFHDEFYLLIQTEGETDVVVQLFDAQGKLIKEQVEHITRYKELYYNSLQLDMSSGTYSIRVYNKDESQEVKVVKY